MIAPDPTSLRAVSVPLAPGARRVVDLLGPAGTSGALYAGDRLTLAGTGTAAILPLLDGLDDSRGLAAVQAWLAAVPHEDRVGRAGSRATALGTLPFDRPAPGRLLLPEQTIGQDRDGNLWATLIVAAHDRPRLHALEAELAALEERAVHAGAHPYRHGPTDRAATDQQEPPFPTLTEVPTGQDYARIVAAAVAGIERGLLRKVVLARSVEARFVEPPVLDRVVRHLRANESSCTIFSMPLESGRFLGATPELLVRRSGTTVTSHPLAGTVGLSGDPVTDAAIIDRFRASAKDRAEHRLVVDDIAAALGPYCTELVVPDHPELVRLHSVAHHGTKIEGTLRASDGRVPSVLELLAALHPTPAVGGVPTDPALAFIAAHEAVPRDHWAGPVGWADAAGDGEWMIGLRSATVLGRLVRLYAGAGIVAGSDPQAELAETTVKFTPMLDALAPGASALL